MMTIKKKNKSIKYSKDIEGFYYYYFFFFFNYNFYKKSYIDLCV